MNTSTFLSALPFLQKLKEGGNGSFKFHAICTVKATWKLHRSLSKPYVTLHSAQQLSTIKCTFYSGFKQYAPVIVLHPLNSPDFYALDASAVLKITKPDPKQAKPWIGFEFEHVTLMIKCNKSKHQMKTLCDIFKKITLWLSCPLRKEQVSCFTIAGKQFTWDIDPIALDKIHNLSNFQMNSLKCQLSILNRNLANETDLNYNELGQVLEQAIIDKPSLRKKLSESKSDSLLLFDDLKPDQLDEVIKQNLEIYRQSLHFKLLY